MSKTVHPPILDIQKVRQSFRSGFWMRQVEVLHGISFQIQPGSVTGLLGPNGAGKTTLIQLIVGLRRPRSGQVLLGGQASFSPTSRRRLGYLPERPYFYEFLTAEKLLNYVGSLYGLHGFPLGARVDQILDLVRLGSARKQEVKTYSKGMLQRLGIAQCLLHDPDILVLDEPMSGLDPIGRKEMRELIQSLSRQGKTILFSSHIIPDVEAICNEVLVLRQGNLVESGPIWNFLAKGPIRTEIALSGISGERIKELTDSILELESIPDGLKVTVPSQTTVNEILGKVLNENGRVLWVSPIRPSLEDIFQ